jgi:hypothetical protein
MHYAGVDNISKHVFLGQVLALGLGLNDRFLFVNDISNYNEVI